MEFMFRVLAFDPGGTTGWALYDRTDDSFWSGQMGPEDHHLELLDAIDLSCKDIDAFYLVTESFEYRNTSRPGLVLASKEYIGIMKLYRQKHGCNFTEQTASKAKGFVRDTHIKKLGLWSPGNKHAMDAMRHLIFFLINNPDMKRLDPSVGLDLLERAYK